MAELSGRFHELQDVMSSPTSGAPLSLPQCEPEPHANNPWGTAVWDAGASFCTDFEEFRAEMTKLFDRSVKGDEAASKLARLRQGSCSVTEYAILFKTLAASCDWKEGALRAMFREGLNFDIQDEIATHDLSQDLEGLINLATRVESRLR
ncbi:Pol poly [Labeo rohita]|uniref:Pol poly n=1 Tax=Labeo rohita TaxID=84645 RepID=A0A498LJ27_LABRO|nr:Pol poly [Labeo rohita]RXN13738.1 Pol poly [Labeo rohita]